MQLDQDGVLILNELLDWKQTDLIREPDAYGWTPLHSAARYGNDLAIKNLLEKDKSVAYVAANGDDGNTALHIAAAVGEVSVMYALLSYCPDCWEMVNSKGQNILHIAAYYESGLVTDFIISMPWVTHLINQKDREGNTPFHVLASKRKDKQLHEYPGADIYAVNNESWTPFDVKYGEIQKEREKDERVNNQMVEVHKSAKTHMIVATLLATISFASSFTIPGGYHQEGPGEGLAVLVRDAAFKGFVITNTIAVICSTSAVLLYISASLFKLNDAEQEKVVHRYVIALWLVIIALVAMTLAFVTGSYAVLRHSLSLVIATCVIACSSFMVYALEVTKLIRRWLKAEGIISR